MWNPPRMTLFFVFTLSGLCVAIHKEFHYVGDPLTWTQAQRFCRVVYSDLATIENPDDNKAITTIQEFLNDAWIGYRDDLRIWKWSLGDADFDSDVDFNSWGLAPYDQRSGSRCAVITQIGFWHDVSCDTLQSAVCYYEQGSPTYAYVDAAMTWYQARGYCRSHYTDLVSVRTYAENDRVTSVVSEDAWIGLHRQPWAWSDSSASNFTNWSDVEPTNNPEATSCATVSTTTGLWLEADCEEEHDFICQALSRSQSSTAMVQDKVVTTTTYKLEFKTEENLDDAALWNQILKQLHVNLKRHALADFKLQWIQTYGQTFNRKQEDKCSPVFSK